MTRRTKTGAASPVPTIARPGGPWLTPPWTLEERVQRIETMGQKINAYIQFMCQIAGLRGASDEVKEKTIAAFYEQMVVAERLLGRIHEDLQLQ